MGIRDILKKKSNVEQAESDPDTVTRLAGPEFTFVRSDTLTSEVIQPPGDPVSPYDDHHLSAPDASHHKNRLSLDMFRSSGSTGARSRSASLSSTKSAQSSSASKRLTQRLHLARSPASSDVVPQDLPQIVEFAPDGRPQDKEGTESQWEARATMLARANEKRRSRPSTPTPVAEQFAEMRIGDDWGAVAGVVGGPRHGGASPQNGAVSSQGIDLDIQEAIRLHEEGDLQRSTALFGMLANPKGANNPLSQVLYGLALRHGWGCAPDPAAAVNYLSAAASNAAVVENLALQAGLKKGGAAKGELVLAIFELANCFRNGWGIPRDPVAAKQYYETAANLGDSDAMNEVGWCYLEGFGTKKDKYAAAKYYRLAEQNGNKTLGNSWIWKDKYNPENAKK